MAAILLVEDNLDTAELEKEMLKDAGHTVTVVATADAAFTALGAKDYDLIVVDLRLPGMGGGQFMASLAAQSGIPSPCVVVCSAVDIAANEETLREIGAKGFIPKPINPRTFAKEIAKILDACKEAGC